MTITALPTAPSRSDDPATFIARADAFVAALAQFVTEANAVAVAMNLNSTTDTSATSNTIGTGSKSFTVSTGKSFQLGMYLVIADTAAPSTNSMYGQVTSYNSGTGALVMNILSVLGSGTKTAWTISQSSAGGAPQSGINRIINGDFEIWQRGVSITPALGSLTSYVSDRWGSYQTGAALNVSRAAGVGEFRYAASFSGGAGNTEAALFQCVEAANSAPLAAAGAITLSAWIYSNVAKTITLNLDTADIADVFSATINRSALAYSHGGNGWEKATLIYSSPHADCVKGIRVRILYGACTSGVFGLTGVQLEAGAVATSFEHLLYGDTLKKCRRYFRGASFYVPATTAQNLGVIDMRAVPTITGGGAGFSSTGTTADTLIAFQTAGAVQALTLSAEL